jgi:Holliday junction resolvase
MGNALESDIQTRLIRHYEANGYLVIKLLRTTKSGIPDLLLIKNGEYTFVEVKRPQGALSELQKRRIKELRSAGACVRVVTDGDIDISEGLITVEENLGF